MPKLHELLAERRSVMGMSQRKLAVDAGVPRSQLQIMEGGGNVTLATVEQVAATLGMQIVAIPVTSDPTRILAELISLSHRLAASVPQEAAAGATLHQSSGQPDEALKTKIRAIEKKAAAGKARRDDS